MGTYSLLVYRGRMALFDNKENRTIATYYPG